MNRRIVLARRPSGMPEADSFRMVQMDVPVPGPNEFLVRHRFLSLDPYMRMRMSEAESYAPPQGLGQVMVGATAGVVAESRHPQFSEGDHVVGLGGWQEFNLVKASEAAGYRKVDVTRVPLSAYLGPLGVPGLTAWYGLVKIIDPAPGETVVVSAAAGAVGSIVGQLAAARGCRVVGIAGGPEKCRHVVENLGFDACVDYKVPPSSQSLADQLSVACPQGIDGNFENVGGTVFDVVLRQLNLFSRVALCGLISGYNGGASPIANPDLLLARRVRLEGFIVSDHFDLLPLAQEELRQLMLDQRLKWRETVAHGLENAPSAFVNMLAGGNIGKQLVALD